MAKATKVSTETRVAKADPKPVAVRTYNTPKTAFTEGRAHLFAHRLGTADYGPFAGNFTVEVTAAGKTLNITVSLLTAVKAADKVRVEAYVDGFFYAMLRNHAGK